MTVKKIRHESKTILDFSSKKVSKNFIRRALRSVEVISIREDKDQIIWIDNYIKIGMYTIQLVIYNKINSNRLKNYGHFSIDVLSNSRDRLYNLSLHSDDRFKEQIWLDKNDNCKLRINDLVDIIYYCNRLHRLRFFL